MTMVLKCGLPVGTRADFVELVTVVTNFEGDGIPRMSHIVLVIGVIPFAFVAESGRMPGMGFRRGVLFCCGGCREKLHKLIYLHKFHAPVTVT